MKYLGIDYGDNRIGLAVCDVNEQLAFALKVLERKLFPAKEQLFGELIRLAEYERIDGGIVIGIPIPLSPKTDLGEPLTCRKVRNFAARLGRRTELPIYLINEALSSNEAAYKLWEAGIKGKKLKNKLDMAAAAIILQQFLNLPLEQRALYIMERCNFQRKGSDKREIITCTN